MFRLSITKIKMLGRATAWLRATPMLAFLATFALAGTAQAQQAEPGVKPLAPASSAKADCNHPSGPKRFFFLYTNGDFDSGTWTGPMEIMEDDLSCLTFEDGDTDFDAAQMHVSCSLDYTADPTAVGNGLTVEDWAIYRPESGGGVCGSITFPGHLTVVKQTIPDGDGQSFNFSGDSPIGSFSLSDGESDSFFVSPGSYDVTETVPTGWELDNLVCSDPTGNSTVDLGTATATAAVASDESVTCTFTNEKIEEATIKVRKVVTAGSTSQSFGFTGDLGSFSLQHNETESFNVEPGTYEIDETVPGGWTLDSAVCDDAGNSNPTQGVTVENGDDITCTFTNSRDQGTIIVRKQTIPDEDPNETEFGFTGPSGNTYNLTDDGQQSFILFTGTYSVEESTVPDGWEFTSASCTGDDDGSDPSNIVLDHDETVTCTFTNTQQGQIVIGKETLPDGDPTSFDFTRTYGGDFSLTDGTFQGSAFLSPGNYSATETVPEGWALDSIVCDDGNSTGNLGTATANVVLDAGEKVRCDFTNRKLEPGIEITKTDGDVSVPEGTSFAYTLAFENTGELDLTGVSISETVPVNTTFNAAGPNGADWNCSGTAAGSTCTHEVGALAVGGSGSVSFPLTVDELWEPDEETGICPEEPQEPTVNNTGDIEGSSINGDVNDSDSDSTPIEVSCEDNPATLTIVKVTEPATEGETFGFEGSSSEDGFNSFSLVTGGDGAASQSFTLPGGSYSVSETSIPDGWELDSTQCSGENTVGDITLEPGGSVTCTFSNRLLSTGVEITKTDGGISVPEGTSFAYTLSYENTGEVELTNVTISETVPANTTFNAAGPDGGLWNCSGTAAGSTCTHDVGTLAAGGSGSVQFPLTVDDIWVPDPVTGLCPPEPEPVQVDNTGSIVGNSVNGQVDDEDSDSTPIELACGAFDLLIEKTDGGISVPEGTSFAYTLSYQNVGNVDLTGVVISESVPVNTTFNAAGPDGGLWNCSGTAAGSTCTHNVGSLAAGASGSVQFPLTVDEIWEPDEETGECGPNPNPPPITNTGSIADDGENGSDSDSSNNSDTDDTPIIVSCDDEQQDPPTIEIVKDPPSQLIEKFDTAEFTITVTNPNAFQLFNVVVTDVESPDCNRNIGTMAPGAVFVYDCERANVSQDFTNVAEVTGEDEEGSDVSDSDDAVVNVLIVDEPEQHLNPIPTLSQWALILMAGLMLLLGGRRVRVWTRR